MRLFIAEKPSLGKIVAGGLGHGKSGNGCIRGSDWVVAWCFGHLYEQAQPDDYSEAWKAWNLDSLPMVPEQWKLKPRPDAKKQIAVIRDLLKEASEVVSAGDPDREGELLIREVLESLKWKGPTKRLWVQDLSESGVKKALASLKPIDQFNGLRDAAETRSRADWLVGMNLTRAYTILARQAGRTDKGVLSVGRVQTPTLALVVNRDLEIENFKPVPYFTVSGEFTSNAGVVPASWVVPEDIADPEGRCITKAQAQAVADACEGNAATVVSFEQKLSKKAPPLPFELTSLTSYASARWGYSAKLVLDIAQSLYEEHKLISYPRSDCPYLADAQHGEAKAILAAVASNYPEVKPLVEGASLSIKSRAFNDKKLGAHTGIIPTGERTAISKLNQSERNVYDAIVRRYLAQFYPDAEIKSVVGEIDCAGHRFKATGKITVKAGWQTVLGKEDEDENDAELPALAEGQALSCSGAKVAEKETKPSPRFTEGTLVQAMANIAKYVEDPKLKARLKETSGIGTTATRGGILETLKKRGFIETKGKQIISTKAGRELVAALPHSVVDPGTTAVWETLLAEIEAGNLGQAKFLEQQIVWITGLLQRATQNGVKIAAAEAIECPTCRKGSLRRINGKNGFFWGCSGFREGCKGAFPDKKGKPDMGTRRRSRGRS